MKFRVLFFILVLTLFCGCLGEKTRTITKYNYVCPDNSIVSDPDKCERIEKEANEVVRYIYVCPDGNLKNNSDDCHTLDHIVVKVTRYVCPDGSVVNDSKECELGTTSLLTTVTPVTTIYTTSIMTITSSTIPTTTTSTTTTLITTTVTSNGCESLGCPSGTQFVGSKNSDKYHKCDCRYAKRIKPENLICFSSKEDAESQGYVPCGVCI